jgi:hypothetical protein
MQLTVAMLAIPHPLRHSPCRKPRSAELICAVIVAALALVSSHSRAQSAVSPSNPLPMQTAAAPVEPVVIHVDADPAHQLNAINPTEALGSSMDVLSHDVIDQVYTPAIMKEMLSAGYGRISYRNNSELRSLAWHWNDNGTWSDAAHQSGYFTGSTDLREPTRYILSYSLPHRGFGHTGGGASMLDDGDESTYWKSNPYLAIRFTGESDALHPQWVVVKWKDPQPINAIKIAWANPYAVSYEVDYWDGKGEPISRDPVGEWKRFPTGTIANSTGGTVTLKLADAPILTREIRIWMTQSSNTCDTHGSGDVRNCVGYAISEIYAGAIDANGALTDAVQHSADNKQTATICSSVDPWHSATDVISGGRAQHTGFDLFFTSGVTRGLPAMIPVTVLYGTPEDAAAEIAYVEKRGYPIAYVEMGEEPDGQHILPEDYAALYLQVAAAIHKVDPKLKLGGPIFEGVNEDIKVWPDAQGRTSWSGRFVDYLRSHGRLADLSFWSFEHYPYEPCEITWSDLYSEPERMKRVMQSFRDNGVPKDVPLMVTESSISWRLVPQTSDIFAALWLADNVGSFFAAGGADFHHSPIQPERIQQACDGWATWSNFVPDGDLNVKGYTSLYFAARLINLEWLQQGIVNRLFPATVDLQDATGNQLITAYAVSLPDGDWSVMLVNRDHESAHAVRISFDDVAQNHQAAFRGRLRFTTFGSQQYAWQGDGANSHADPDEPPVTMRLSVNATTIYSLPKASVSILRGKVRGFPRER